MKHKVQLLLERGELVTSEKGNSMLPLIKSNQKHLLRTCTLDDVEEGDIVYCKVRGRYITHKVFAKNNVKGVLIGNNKGHMNGWTKQVFGKVVEVFV